MSDLTVVKAAQPLDAKAIETALIRGDLAQLTSEQRVAYYKNVCDSLGLNPLTKPFDYIQLNGKLVLYAKRDATDQLRSNRAVSIEIVSREKIGDVYVVTARAKMPDGRCDESTGAVHVGKSTGDTLANLYMKAETKAKRRVTLSICGLGLLDETEVETITAEPYNGKSTASVSSETKPELLRPDDAVEYRVPFGKHKGKALAEMELKDIQSYVDWLQESAEKQGKPLSDNAVDFINRAEGYLLAVDEMSAAGVFDGDVDSGT